MGKRICFEYGSVGEGAASGVRLTQTGFDRFEVKYGLQVKTGLAYGKAATELGACIMHLLACDGKLDNRTKAEAREAGDKEPYYSADDKRPAAAAPATGEKAEQGVSKGGLVEGVERGDFVAENMSSVPGRKNDLKTILSDIVNACAWPANSEPDDLVSTVEEIQAKAREALALIEPAAKVSDETAIAKLTPAGQVEHNRRMTDHKGAMAVVRLSDLQPMTPAQVAQLERFRAGSVSNETEFSELVEDEMIADEAAGGDPATRRGYAERAARRIMNEEETEK